MNPNSMQVGGDHYRSEYQHWDFVQACLNGRYLEGQITKYVTRWRKKNGIEDLKKAQHYANKLLTEFRAGRVHSMVAAHTYANKLAGKECPDNMTPFHNAQVDFSRINNLSYEEALIVEGLVCWNDELTIRVCQTRIDRLIKEAEAEEPGPGYVKQ